MNILYHWLCKGDIIAFLLDSKENQGPLLENIFFHNDINYDEIICCTHYRTKQIKEIINDSINIGEINGLKDKVYNIKKIEFSNPVEFHSLYKNYLESRLDSKISIKKSRYISDHFLIYLTELTKKIKLGSTNGINYYFIQNDFSEKKSYIWTDTEQKNLKFILSPYYTPDKSLLGTNYFRFSKERTYSFSELYDKISSLETGPKQFADIITTDKDLLEKIRIASFLAETDMPILLLGENGTGKELFANAIYNASKRNDKELIILNCTATPTTLIESELFGHVKKSFNNAVEKTGKIELANNGTLFLDEIGDLPLEVQPKLLRVLQDGNFTKVGGIETKYSNFRLICATNRKLGEMVKRGEFREDLYYRINDFELIIPPLRERNRRDIDLIISRTITKLKSEYENYRFIKISKQARDQMLGYSWPGNVRQLLKFMKKAFLLAAYLTQDIDNKVLDLCAFPTDTSTNNCKIIAEKTSNQTMLQEASNFLTSDDKYRKLFKVELSEDINLKHLFNTIEEDYIREALKRKIPQKKIAEMFGFKNQQDISKRKIIYNIE